MARRLASYTTVTPGIVAEKENNCNIVGIFLRYITLSSTVATVTYQHLTDVDSIHSRREVEGCDIGATGCVDVTIWVLKQHLRRN